MITISKFQPKFFIELYKALATYGTLWITEDGNQYRTQKQAVNRCITKGKLATMNGEDENILRWIRMDLSTFPFDLNNLGNANKQLRQIFDDQEIEQRKERRNEIEEQANPEITPMQLSDEEILAKFNAEKGSSAPEVKTIKIGDADYDFEKVKVAIKAVVDSKFNASTGLSKTLDKIDSLTDEQKALIVEELSK